MSGKRNRNRADRALVNRLLKKLKRTGNVRPKVQRVKSSVHEGDYENDLKLTVAIERLLRDL